MIEIFDLKPGVMLMHMPTSKTWEVARIGKLDNGLLMVVLTDGMKNIVRLPTDLTYFEIIEFVKS